MKLQGHLPARGRAAQRLHGVTAPYSHRAALARGHSQPASRPLVPSRMGVVGATSGEEIYMVASPGGLGSCNQWRRPLPCPAWPR